MIVGAIAFSGSGTLEGLDRGLRQHLDERSRALWPHVVGRKAAAVIASVSKKRARGI